MLRDRGRYGGGTRRALEASLLRGDVGLKMDVSSGSSFSSLNVAIIVSPILVPDRRKFLLFMSRVSFFSSLKVAIVVLPGLVLDRRKFLLFVSRVSSLEVN